MARIDDLDTGEKEKRIRCGCNLNRAIRYHLKADFCRPVELNQDGKTDAKRSRDQSGYRG